jgi:serine/threonine-protein kinase
MQLSVDAHTVTPLLQTQANELNAKVSPDGRWLAYQSDDSGSPEVYVRPFPNVNDGGWQVSTGRGRVPTWSGNGRQLFYLAGDGAMVSAPIESGTSLSPARP